MAMLVSSGMSQGKPSLSSHCLQLDLISLEAVRASQSAWKLRLIGKRTRSMPKLAALWFALDVSSKICSMLHVDKYFWTFMMSFFTGFCPLHNTESCNMVVEPFGAVVSEGV